MQYKYNIEMINNYLIYIQLVYLYITTKTYKTILALFYLFEKMVQINQ